MNDTSHWWQTFESGRQQCINVSAIGHVAASHYDVGTGSIESIDLLLCFALDSATAREQDNVARTL